MSKSNQGEAFQSTFYQGEAQYASCTSHASHASYESCTSGKSCVSSINQEIRGGEAQSINLASIIVEENKIIIYDASDFKILP